MALRFEEEDVHQCRSICPCARSTRADEVEQCSLVFRRSPHRQMSLMNGIQRSNSTHCRNKVSITYRNDVSDSSRSCTIDSSPRRFRSIFSLDAWRQPAAATAAITSMQCERLIIEVFGSRFSSVHVHFAPPVCESQPLPCIIARDCQHVISTVATPIHYLPAF